MESVRVRLILDVVKDAKLVPIEAVQTRRSGPYVFVVARDDTVQLRFVTPGQRQDGGMVVIEDGLAAGEKVVVTGQPSLGPGTKVAPRPQPSPSQPQHLTSL